MTGGCDTSAGIPGASHRRAYGPAMVDLLWTVFVWLGAIIQIGVFLVCVAVLGGLVYYGMRGEIDPRDLEETDYDGFGAP
jgi:hypothetical protein